MKKTITFLKLSAIVGLIFFLPNILKAQDPTVAYLCGAGVTLTLKAEMPDYVIQPTDEVIWQEVNDLGVPVGAAVTQPGSTPDLVLSGLTIGKHLYRVHVLSSNPVVCTGDPSDPYEVHMLPTSTVLLTSTVDDYCAEGNTNNTPAIVTATATPASALPTGVNYDYTWTATDGTTAIDLSTVGTSALVAAAQYNTSDFTMTTTAIGTYEFTATATYTFPANTFFKSADGASTSCSEDSAPKTITVTPRPDKPTISFQ